MFMESPLQDVWIPVFGDRYFALNKGVFDIIDDKALDRFKKSETNFKENNVWIPSQEQLQRIAHQNRLMGWRLFFDNFLSKHSISAEPISPDRFLLFWCIFVHEQVYNLVWNWKKKKWIKA